MRALFVLLALVTMTAQPTVPPLTQSQITQLQALIRQTERQDKHLRSQLARRQRELAAAYATFELNEESIKRLQSDIIDLQKKLLGNYHQLQVSLRQTVGPQRFNRLKQRIDRHLKSTNNKNKRTRRQPSPVTEQ